MLVISWYGLKLIVLKKINSDTKNFGIHFRMWPITGGQDTHMGGATKCREYTYQVWNIRRQRGRSYDHSNSKI